jgi:multiple antibiotic resistance protein
MVFPPPRREEEDQLLTEPFIVPLATPLMAGPSVLATLLVLVSSEPQKMTDWLVAMLVAWGITSAILMFAPAISRVLKERGTIAVERLMGMILVMVSVQMFLNGLDHYLQR